MIYLHYETVIPKLKAILSELMHHPLFNDFRLVGGTALSLRYGHRFSVDIDLFSDNEYGSIDFHEIEQYLIEHYPYYDKVDPTDIVSFGRSYYIGQSENEAVKLDLFYTDTFIRKYIVFDDIRFAHTDDILAMKIDAIVRGGRKKDFWDIHLLMDNYNLLEMIALHHERYPWIHDADVVKQQLIDFSLADDMPDPHCLLHKNWDIIKLDIIDFMEESR